MEGNFNYKKRGRPSGQKNAQGHNAGRPKKVDSKQKKLSFTSVNRTVNNNINNNSSSSNSSMNSTATPVQEEPISLLADDDHVPLGEKIFDTMVPSSEEDKYDVSDDDILDEIDCNDEDEDEDINRQEGTEDIIGTTSQTPHHQYPNDTTNVNENESNNTSNDNVTEIAGVIQKYLSDVQKRIVSEKYPAEYNRGTFWVRPKDPYFALLDDLNPNGLYYPRIFLWIPHLLLEKLGKTLKCPTCNSDLKSKGYTDKPRRVVDITDCFYIMASRYDCKNEKCSFTSVANNENIIRQLPKFLQCQYPGYMTHRSGVSKTVGDLLRPCMQNSVGPKRFQKILRELHKLKHARSEFQYLNAAVFRIENPTIDQYFISNNNNVLHPFSDFGDKNGYGGYIPSPQYFRSFYTSYTEEIRHLLDKQMMVLDAKYLKGDHSFKIIKLIGKVDGAPMFTALYTILNEYEEVRLQFLVPTKSLFHLKYAFNAVRRSLDFYGHGQPEIFFTDNVRGDKNILEDVFPSLKKALQPVTDPEPGKVVDHSHYPKLTIPGDSVEIRCINKADEMVSAAQELLNLIKVSTSRTSEPTQSKQIVVGFDCEWPTDPTTHAPGKLATIQITYNNIVDIYCVHHLDVLPQLLIDVLSNSNIIKIGRAIQGDLNKIERDFALVSGTCAGGYDIARFCKERGAIDTQRISLSEICARVLERFLPKDNNVRLSDWSGMELSDTQKEYAALDAWAGLQIYHKLKRNEVIGKRILRPVNEGTSISYHPWSMVQAAAYGEISCQRDKFSNKKLTKAQVIITVKQVLIPNAVDRDGKPLSEYGQVPFEIVARLCDLRTSRPVEIQNNTQNVVEEIDSSEQSNIDISTAEIFESEQVNNNDNIMPPDDDYNSNDNITSILRDNELPSHNQNPSTSQIEEESRELGNQQFSSLPEQLPSEEPIRSRVLKDVFHLMDQIKVPRRHGLANDFSRKLRDALFVVDEEDKIKVEDILTRNQITWDEKLLRNPGWVFRRVKRTVPPPEILYPVVKNLFETYGPLKCARTGRPLFDNEAWKQSKNVLSSIHEGHVSDPPGYSFYFKMGQDRDGLTLYRCCRGTNSLEGGIHQNVIRKFGSFGASPALADAVLADYRLRHNIDVGTMNRHGKIHKGHYEPWLTQHINDLRLQLGLPAIYNEPGVHKYALHLADSDESFGISTLPRSLMDLYNIRAADSSLLSTRNKTSSSDLASLIILHGSTAHTAGSQFIFIAQRQGAAHAIIPVQTQVERNKYDSLIRQHFPQQLQRNQQPDFDKFSKLWSAFVDGKSIFYKAPEHLRSYHTKWCEYQNIHLTKNSYNEQIETLQQDLSSPSRKRNIPEAQNPAALKIPRLQAIIDEATASSSSSSPLPISSPLSTEEETGNNEHINSNFTSTSYETIHNITTTTNRVEPTIFYNPYLSQQLLYPPFPFIYAAPSSSTSTFDGLHTPPRVRHCKTCHSNTCIGRTGRGKCSLLNNT